ncbi:hypothetical protein BH10PSE7_BH10PSE7_07750 [soil metagenome]
MKLATALLVSALSLPLSAFAQEQPSQREMELAKQVFQTMGLLSDAKRKLPRALGAQFGAEIASKGGKDAEKAADEFAVEFAKQFDVKTEQLSALAAPVAADIFTEEELAALQAFYATPVGRQIGVKYGDYQGKTMKVMLEWMRAEMPGMIAVTRKAMEERGYAAPK